MSVSDRLRVQIYYEDTDHSGVVYHANYLRYFERAREHLLGVPELVRLWEQDGVGFVVYKAAMTYKAGAEFGETVEVRTTVHLESDYRLRFEQDVWRVAKGGREVPEELLVEGHVELVCVDADKKLTPLPVKVRGRLGV